MSRALKRIFNVEDQLLDYNNYSENSADGEFSLETGFASETVSSPETLLSSADENCIVQCPACFTRFSLPLSAITSQTDPRFHCSQCDTIFCAEVENSVLPPIIAEKVQPDLLERPVPITNVPVTNEVVDTLVSRSFEETEPAQVFSSSSTSSSSSVAEVISQEKQPTPIHVVQSEKANSFKRQDNISSSETSRSFEIPRPSFEIPRPVSSGPVSSDWSLGAPHESAMMPPEPLTSPKSRDRATEPSQINLDLNIAPQGINSTQKHYTEQNNQVNYGEPLLKTSPINSINSNKKTPNQDKNGHVAIKRRQLLLSSVQRMRINIPLGNWRAPLIIAGPLVSFFIALFFISALLKTNPLQSEEMITAAIPGISRIAPPGLAVIEARLRKITLESGESILALSGRVKNNSGKLIKRITLDGLVFDKQGALISEKQVLVSSPLAQSKIRSLSLEMIEDIEANASKGKTTVKDGESAPFVVTFRPQEVVGSRYFSTRINSIK